MTAPIMALLAANAAHTPALPGGLCRGLAPGWDAGQGPCAQWAAGAALPLHGVYAGHVYRNLIDRPTKGHQ